MVKKILMILLMIASSFVQAGGGGRCPRDEGTLTGWLDQFTEGGKPMYRRQHFYLVSESETVDEEIKECGEKDDFFEERSILMGYKMLYAVYHIITLRAKDPTGHKVDLIKQKVMDGARATLRRYPTLRDGNKIAEYINILFRENTNTAETNQILQDLCSKAKSESFYAYLDYHDLHPENFRAGKNSKATVEALVQVIANFLMITDDEIGISFEDLMSLDDDENKPHNVFPYIKDALEKLLISKNPPTTEAEVKELIKKQVKVVEEKRKAALKCLKP